MNKVRFYKKIVIVLSTALFLSLVFNAFLMIKYKSIFENRNRASLVLENKETITKNDKDVKVSGNKYDNLNNIPSGKNHIVDLLFIGNSITLHAKSSYWWGEWGMAASEKENDYAHLIAYSLATHHNVSLTAVNYSAWELQKNDRAETFQMIDELLDTEYEYIFVQLGENCSQSNNLEQDYIDLIKYIKDKTHNSEIFVVSNYWKDDAIDSIKKDICLSEDIFFVDLKSPSEKDGDGYSEMDCGINTTVLGADKKEHVVEHDGVSRHPGDRGHQYIAEKILSAIDEQR